MIQGFKNSFPTLPKLASHNTSRVSTMLAKMPLQIASSRAPRERQVFRNLVY